jgi:hypothetical protein
MNMKVVAANAASRSPPVAAVSFDERPRRFGRGGRDKARMWRRLGLGLAVPQRARVCWAEEENGARWGNGAPRATVSGACPSDQCQRIGFRGRAPRGRVAGVA